MAKSKKSIINVQGTDVTILSQYEQDYISLTDMVRNFDGGSALIEQWLKNKDTVLFLGVWEHLNNPDFNSPEFEGIKNEAGRNSFYLSVKRWIEAANAIGLIASAGGMTAVLSKRGQSLSMEELLQNSQQFEIMKNENRLETRTPSQLSRNALQFGEHIQAIA